MLKHFVLVAFTALSTLMVLTGCNDDEPDTVDRETVIELGSIPDLISMYVMTHFPDNPIVRVIQDVDDGITTYDVLLEGSIELEFDADNNIIEIDAPGALPASVIMQPIRDYVSTNYPSQVITGWDLQGNEQDIELSNDVELVFDLDGNFVRVDRADDDDSNYDDETVLTDGDIPAEITTFVNTHFPDNAIVQVIREVDSGITSYEVTLSGNIELDFDTDFRVTEVDAAGALPSSLVPSAILDYTSDNYPDQVITGWELDLTEQTVELSNDVELVFDLDGNFLRIDD